MTAFYIIASRKVDLCAGIILYYCAYIIVGAYTVGLRVDEQAHWFYMRQSLIDLAAIVFICYLSYFDKKAAIIYLLYAAIIIPSMLLNGLMMVDQAFEANILHSYHLAYQPYAQSVDFLFAVIGSANVSRYIIRFLPFGGR